MGLGSNFLVLADTPVRRHRLESSMGLRAVECFSRRIPLGRVCYTGQLTDDDQDHAEISAQQRRGDVQRTLRSVHRAKYPAHPAALAGILEDGPRSDG